MNKNKNKKITLHDLYWEVGNCRDFENDPENHALNVYVYDLSLLCAQDPSLQEGDAGAW